MPDPINTTEQALISRIKEVLGNRVKGVASLPGGWDANMLQRLIVNSPAVYVAFLGGPVQSSANDPAIMGRWEVYAVSADPSGDAARRAGARGVIGAYEMLALVVPSLHGLVIPGIGSVELSGSVDNLFTGTLAQQNLTIYSAQFSVPLQFELESDWAALDDFLTFHADFDLFPKDGNIEASMDVDLEQ